MPDLRCFLDVEDLQDISQLEAYVQRSDVLVVFLSGSSDAFARHLSTKTAARDASHKSTKAQRRAEENVLTNRSRRLGDDDEGAGGSARLSPASERSPREALRSDYFRSRTRIEI